MSIQYIHRVSEKLAPDLGLSEKLPPSLCPFRVSEPTALCPHHVPPAPPGELRSSKRLP